MDKLIPLAMVVIAVSVLAIATQLLLRPCCCPPQPTTVTQMTDTVTIVPGDTVTLVPGDSLLRLRPGQPRLVVAPNRAVLIPAR